MDEMLSLINSLTNEVINAKPVVMSKGKKVIIDKETILDGLERLKLMVSMQSENNNFVTPLENNEETLIGKTNPEIFGLEGEALLRQAKLEADKIKAEAEEFADYIFKNMLISLSKVATAVKNGKERVKIYNKLKMENMENNETR